MITIAQTMHINNIPIQRHSTTTTQYHSTNTIPQHNTTAQTQYHHGDTVPPHKTQFRRLTTIPSYKKKSYQQILPYKRNTTTQAQYHHKKIALQNTTYHNAASQTQFQHTNVKLTHTRTIPTYKYNTTHKYNINT